MSSTVVGCSGCSTSGGVMLCPTHGPYKAAVNTASTVMIQCEDCKQWVWRAFAIIPPPGRTEGGGHSFWLCENCWDSIVSAAVMARTR